MSADRMQCARCGLTKAYPDGFPNLTFAECWRCAWLAHVASAHPKTWAERRRDWKRARQIAANELRKSEMDDRARVVLLEGRAPVDTAVPEQPREQRSILAMENPDG